VVKENRSHVKLFFDEICYLESQKESVNIVCENRTVKTKTGNTSSGAPARGSTPTNCSAPAGEETAANTSAATPANADSHKVSFRAFLDGFYDLQLPLTCNDVYTGDSLPLPQYELIDEFFNANLDRPWFHNEYAQELWTSEDDFHQYGMLGEIEMDHYVLTFVAYEVEGTSVFGGVRWCSVVLI
jgi:hypothetical protein